MKSVTEKPHRITHFISNFIWHLNKTRTFYANLARLFLYKASNICRKILIHYHNFRTLRHFSPNIISCALYSIFYYIKLFWKTWQDDGILPKYPKIYFLITKTTSVLTIFLFILICAEAKSQDIQLQQFENYFDELDCDEAWDVLWKDFLEGDPVASATIPLFITHRGLELPRHADDFAIVTRDIVFFTFHAAELHEELRPYLAHYVELSREHYPGISNRLHLFDNCLPISSPSRDCLEVLLQYNAIPTVDEFRREIEAAQRDGLAATCE